MTEIHHKQESTISPFAERIELDDFFDGANLEEILTGIEESIEDSVPVMVLSGIEGAGKTMLCHRLQERLGPKCGTVYFPMTVDSFEDVVKSVADHLGVASGSDQKGSKIEGLMASITGSLQSSDKSLLIIFDDAENIYLATLERIRKMLDRLLDAGAKLHILFSGRESFSGNFEQLSICDFNEIEEQHFHIEPLDEVETSEYLLSAGEKFEPNGAETTFTREVVKNIFDVAKGNFRMTNILAEEALQNQGDDNSFMVLLENVKDEVEAGYEAESKLFFNSFLEEYKPYLPWGGGLLLVCLLMLFFFNAEEEQPRLQRDQEVTIEIRNTKPVDTYEQLKKIEEIEPVLSQKEPVPKIVIEDRVAKQRSRPVRVPQEGTVVVKPEVLSIGSENTAGSPASLAGNRSELTDKDTDGGTTSVDTEPLESLGAAEKTAAVSSGTSEVNDLFAAEKAKDAEQRTAASVIAIKPIEKKQKLETVLPIQKKTIEKKAVERVVELRPVQTMKTKPGTSPKPTASTEASREVRIKEQTRNGSLNRTVGQLYNDRRVAGKGWENGAKNHLFTVQLMVLTSETAELNLRRMLAEDRYRQEAGNFYIFPKGANSDHVMVFYGEYRTIARARLAQNSLPQFLRDHKPYAISIKGAMAKVNR